jgi:hypothetical protein
MQDELWSMLASVEFNLPMQGKCRCSRSSLTTMTGGEDFDRVSGFDFLRISSFANVSLRDRNEFMYP